MNNHSYKLFRIYGYPGFGLLLYLIFILLNPFERTYNSWRFYVVIDFLLEFTFCTAFAAVLFETGIQLTKLLNKWYPWEGRMIKRLGIQLALHIFIVYLILNLFFLFRFPAHFDYDELLFRQTVIIGVIFSLLVTTVFTAEYFFYKWNDAKLRSIEMEQYTTQAQMEALKLQLDPHFLFNNLSTVTALIDDQPSIAVSYVGELSSIYRYILNNRTKNMITIKEELDFIKSYLYLYEIRYGQGIQVSIDDSTMVNHLGLPPLTLQLLIENAIKHNSFSTDAPLCIQISFPYGIRMVVENNKSPKMNTEPSTNLGLRNISERYRLMGKPVPAINEQEQFYRVEISLLTIEATLK